MFPMRLASRLRTPSSTRILIQIRFSQRRWERPFHHFRSFPKALVPCGDPSNAIISPHKNRTITQSPGSLGVQHQELPCLCPTHVFPACEASRQVKAVLGCVLQAFSLPGIIPRGLLQDLERD